MTLLLSVFSCEKELIAPVEHENMENRGLIKLDVSIDNVTDPDEDEDFDGKEIVDLVTDPDEDEDFDGDGGEDEGK